MGKKCIFVILLALAIIAGLRPCVTSAATLYFTADDGNNPPTYLYSINTSTHAIQYLGSIDALIPGMSPSPNFNVLYAVDRYYGRLLTIDVSTFPASGSVQVVGNLNRDIRELAYDSTNNILYGFNFANNHLVTLNQADGTAAGNLGDIGFRLRAMTFDQVTGTLYGISADTGVDEADLYTIDTGTANATLVNPGEPNRNQISGIYALTTGNSTSTMYAIGRDEASYFFRINKSTAVETVLRSLPALTNGTVARDLSAPFLQYRAIPTLSQWGMIVLILLFGISAILVLRAKTRASADRPRK